MSPGNIPIRRQVLIQPRQHLRTARRVAPIPHQVHHDSKHTLQDHAPILHPRIRISSQLVAERPARLGIGKHGEPLTPEREGKELGAHIRRDAAEDDLRFVLRLDSVAELGVVPGIAFAVAADQRGVGVHADDFLGEEAVGAALGGGGEDDGDVEEAGDAGVGDHVVAVLDHVEVADLRGCFSICVILVGFEEVAVRTVLYRPSWRSATMTIW